MTPADETTTAEVKAIDGQFTADDLEAFAEWWAAQDRGATDAEILALS